MEISQNLPERLGLKMQPFQQEILDEWEKDIVVCAGRQTGKSTVIAIKALTYILQNSGKTVLILSKAQRQAAHLFDRIIGFAQALNLDIQYASRTKLTINGSTIMCLPSGYTGDSIRGYTVDLLILEEAAYIPQEVWWTVNPMLGTTGGQRILISTPDEPSGFFWDAFHSAEYRRWHVDAEKSPLWKRSELKKAAATMPKEAYAREIKAKFMIDRNRLIPRDLIMSCIVPPTLEETGWTWPKPVVIGVDFARFGEDSNAIAYAAWKEGRIYIKADKLPAKKRLTWMTGFIKAEMEKHKTIRRVVTDEGGLGAGPTDSLVEAFGKNVVIGITNQRRSVEKDDRQKKLLKHDLYTHLMVLMEHGRIALRDDMDLIKSLATLQYDYTEEGNLRIHGIDDHIAEAVVRAVWILGKSPPHEGSAIATVSSYVDADINESNYYSLVNRYGTNAV